FIVDHPLVGIPLMWQQRLVGIMAMRLPAKPKIQPATLDLLQEFARRIAPDLENAILHTQIQRQKNLVETVLLSSPAGILVLDDQLHIVRSNTAASQSLPLNAGSESSFAAILGGEKVPEEALEALQKDFTSGKTFRRDIQIGANSFSLDAAPLADPAQWVVILNDVTALTELSRLKTRLMRLATHDLKNPLGRILGYGSVMLGSRDDLKGVSEQTKRFIEEMFNAAQDMNRIIADILDSEEIRSSAFKREPLNLTVIVERVMTLYQPTLAAKKLTFTTQIADNLPQISGNARYLNQVVTNLVSNAVKYTPDEGSITLRLYPTEEQVVRLEVEDTGYGMSAEEQVKLFTEFYRIRTRATAHITGTGLGLSLAKWIVEVHGGRIWVKSEPDVGSTFFVELPTIQEEEPVDVS
ncbi:MAG: hypothetical protein K8I30_15760, partial [Anaerolineae bacterium]|nr:hypothetical protein [Anaerolineae bacterium]